MAAIDERAIREYGIPGRVLMENAGRGLARVVQGFPVKAPWMILCGKGNNGGDGLVCARFLKEFALDIEVLLFCEPQELKPDPGFHYEKLLKADVPVRVLKTPETVVGNACSFDRCGGIVDALFGLGLNRALQRPWCELLEAVNASAKVVVSADVPSGLNADTGEVMGGCIKANATAVFGALKKGLFEGCGPEHAGQIHLIDIGLPPQLLS